MADIRPPRFRLEIDGRNLENWTNVEIIMSLDAIAHTFSVGYHHEGDLSKAQRFPYRPHMACQLYDDDELIVDGVLDQPRIEYSESSYRIELAGASRTGQLVDSSNVAKGRGLKNVTALDIVRHIAKPFDIPANHVGGNPGKKLKTFKFQDGEGAADAIMRAAQETAQAVFTETGSELIVGIPGTHGVEGKFMELAEPLEGGIDGNSRDRFSVYIVKKRSTDDIFGNELPSGIAKVEDPAVPIFRPLILRADGKPDYEGLLRQAKHAMHVRAGRALHVTYTVPGWRRLDGALWRPNTVLLVEDAMLDLYEELVVSAVSLRLSDQGAQTTMELVRREAYDVAEPPTGKDEGSAIGW